jgi:hypothetical protein
MPGTKSAKRERGEPTVLIRAPHGLGWKLAALLRLTGGRSAEYVARHLGPAIEKDWAALPPAVREHLERRAPKRGAKS